MAALAHFSESSGKYLVQFPDGSAREFVCLDDAALACDGLACELHYKGKTA
jgi:hypothetical protein